MISLHRDRRIVPRWRLVKPRDAHAEEWPLKSGVPVPLNPQSQLELDDALDRWKVEKTLGTALELLNSARDLQGRPELEEASRVVLAHRGASNIARALADHKGGIQVTTGDRDAESIPEIVLARAALRRDPHNAFAALNLAHAYCAIGRWDKADRLVLQALCAAGSNRTILRGAARYYLHVKEVDKAHHLLARAPSLLHDPWVLAGELALAEVRGRTSTHVKAARALAASDSIAPLHRSELNAALGDLQVHRGDHKLARKSYLVALDKPTENVVAQAHFLSMQGQVTSLPVDEAMSRCTVAPEARGMEALSKGDWKAAQEQARLWLALEPFSNRPVNLGFTAADIGRDDMVDAEYFADRGRRANPGNPMQHNNHAYALAKLGRVAKAEEVFAVCYVMIAKEAGDKGELHVYKATAGLIAWRKGDIEVGRRSYREAAEYFDKSSDKRRLAHALGRWADEERRTENFTEATTLLARARLVAKSKERSFEHVLLERVDQSLKKALERPAAAFSKQVVVVQPDPK